MWNSNSNHGGSRDTKMHSDVVLFSRLLAFLIPIVVGAYWPLYSVSQGAAIALLRPLIFGASLLLALLWYSAPATSAEVQGACVLGLLSAALLISSLTAADPARALAGWAKLLVLCGISLLLSRALRHLATARSLGIALVLSGVVIGAFTVLTYVRFLGLVMPTYKLTREFKGMAERSGIPLNAIPFTSVFSFLAGMCLVRANWFLYFLGFTLFGISSVFTGSRAPLGVLLLSALALALLNAFRSRWLPVRLIASLLAVTLPIAITVWILHTPFRHMSLLTEGRWDLWYVACKKFAAQPVLGSGYGSWHDDLVSMLPGAYSLTGSIAKTIVGGYHNEYLGILAEQGLVGFIPAMVLVGFLFRGCWKSAFRNWNTWQSGQWVLFACLFLLLRAGVEIPGLFGDGNEPADFLAYIFLAIVISRFSTEEDFLRSTTSSSWNAPPVQVARGSANEWTKPAGNARRPQGCDVPVGFGRSYL